MNNANDAGQKVRLERDVGPDIVGRLRKWGDGLPAGILLMREAANEIERLNTWAVAYYQEMRAVILRDRARFIAVRQFAEEHQHRGDDCGRLARMVLDVTNDVTPNALLQPRICREPKPDETNDSRAANTSAGSSC